MIKRRILLAVFASLLIMTASGECMAEEENASGEEYRPHRIELFLGNTHDEGENNFTIGLSYGYRVNRLLGVGASIERVGGEEVRDWIIIIPFYLHPYKGWRFVLAPGIEGQIEDNEFLFRVGAAYEFEIGRWLIAPEFNLDFVDGREVPVFGFSFGYAF